MFKMLLFVFKRTFGHQYLESGLDGWPGQGLGPARLCNATSALGLAKAREHLGRRRRRRRPGRVEGVRSSLSFVRSFAEAGRRKERPCFRLQDRLSANSSSSTFPWLRLPLFRAAICGFPYNLSCYLPISHVSPTLLGSARKSYRGRRPRSRSEQGQVFLKPFSLAT